MNRGPQHSASLVIIVSTLTAMVGCAPLDALVGLFTDAAACAAGDACSATSGTPLAEWLPPDLIVVAEHGDHAGLPRLSVVLKPREWAPVFCPEIPDGLIATVDGHALGRVEADAIVDCDNAQWTFGPDAWPMEYASTSTLEVADGETTLAATFSFSLTQPPMPTLSATALSPGQELVVEVVLPQVEELSVGPAALQIDKAEPIYFPVTAVDGVLRMDLPDDVIAGPATLSIGYQARADGACEPLASCQAAVYGELRFGVEVVDG